jgi:MFS family permease
MSSPDAVAASGGSAPVGRAFSSAYAWWVVFVLCVASIVAFIDRQIINLLVGPIKQDLGLTDVQISLLQGVAFALFHAALAVPLGRLADRYNRKWIIIIGIICWSIACAGSGMVSGFLGLFVMRMLIGSGEATLSPAGYSMLADYFPREKLGKAISFFLGSGFIGSGIALIFGGAILASIGSADAVTLPLMGEVRSWQAAFLIVSLPGLLCVALMLTVREPPRSSFGRVVDSSAPLPPFREVLAFVVVRRRTIGAIFLGYSLLAAMQFGLGAWTPEFFARTYGWERSEIGYTYGLNVVFAGTLGVLVGGWLSDQLATRGYADANLRTGVIAGLCALPFVVSFPLMPDGNLAMLLLVPATFFSTMPFGAGTAALPLLTPNRMRAQMVALYLVVANLLGQGLGPFLTAALTDYVFQDPSQLYLSVSIAGGVLLVLAVGVIASGLPGIAAALKQADAEARAGG